MEQRPFVLFPRIKRGRVGGIYIRWGRKLWLIG